MDMDQAPAYIDSHPDGRRFTWDDLRPGDLVQVWVGAWPYDTEFATVTETRGRNVHVAYERYSGPTWISQRRIASLLRPVTQ
ncbi:hypothetical protein [Streptomyces sp. NPDC001568]|uniref:hypothetical protein n=1 Tax=Streptomyces sp. NPDC001568 TaxID=3364588 RepID=UPI0036AE3C69